MGVVILTSDTLDGKLVCSYLLKIRNDIRAIVYEEKPTNIKSFLKSLYFFVTKKITFLDYETLKERFKDLIIIRTNTINAHNVYEALLSIGPEVIVVVGTSKIKKEIYSLAQLGAINLHTGILPFYRGADSEFWALYNHEPHYIGVSIHFINDALDAGDIIVRLRQRVLPCDSHRSLKIRNLLLGAEKLNEVVESLYRKELLPRKQDDALSTTYLSLGHYSKDRRNYPKGFLSSRAAIKEFGFDTFKVRERVAVKPLVSYGKRIRVVPKKFLDSFVLRLDADTYPNNFSEYLKVFSQSKECITIFFCASSFLDKKEAIKACQALGLDVQSHGFYHHVYNDFRSNLYNISKAKEFFLKLGIRTSGFSAPQGRYNLNLIRALEEEGYSYSSDFSFDYLGWPRHPAAKNNFFKVLEIPVFPVCPELFFYQGLPSDKILGYFKEALCELKRCNLPPLIYAHTSSFSDNPKLLSNIVTFALGELQLKPITMTELYTIWDTYQKNFDEGSLMRVAVESPHKYFLGEEVRINYYNRIKMSFKELIDYEVETPALELQCNPVKKVFKALIRKCAR